jgi:hypothetical protein
VAAALLVTAAGVAPSARAAAPAAFPRIPLHFELGSGHPSAPGFVARRRDGTLWLLPGESVLVLRDDTGAARALLMRWVDAGGEARVVGEDRLAGRVNHVRGRDPARWRTGIPTYGRVRQDELYPGIDVVYYGRAGHVEHDLQVAPGADAGQARIEISGADTVTLDARGDLVLALAGRTVRLHAPVSYQERDGVREEVASRWLLEDGRRARVALGDYDRSRALVVDPVLSYASYFGGDGEDNGGGIHVDASGITFGGNTLSTDLLPTELAGTPPGGFDAFVAKLDPSGSSLLYATYFGGGGDEIERDLAVDPAGDAYLFGETTSSDLPVTGGAVDGTCGEDGFCDGGGPDTFVARLDGSDGTLVYATYLGGSGSDIAGKIAVDAGGHAYLAGYTNSSDLPATEGAYDETCGSDGTCDATCTDGFCESPRRDCFAAKLDAAGESLGYPPTWAGAPSTAASAWTWTPRGARSSWAAPSRRTSGRATARTTSPAAATGSATPPTTPSWRCSTPPARSSPT